MLNPVTESRRKFSTQRCKGAKKQIGYTVLLFDCFPFAYLRLCVKNFLREQYQSIRYLIVFLISITAHCHASESPSEESVVNRIRAHLLIKDPESACAEARIALQTYPKSNILWQAYIKALAKANHENEMMAAWNTYCAIDQSAYQNREIMEAMAWSVISTGSLSNSPIIRLHALLGAFFGQDNKGVDILYNYMKDGNSIVRNAAVQLSSQLRDAKLSDAILRLFREEKVVTVRLQVIKAIGKMRLLTAKQELTSIIADDKSSAEEKAAAIQSLIVMLDSANREEVWRLATSNRRGLRLMACKVVAHFLQEDCLDCIFPLIHDHCGEIRAAALQVLGILRTKNYQGHSIASLAQQMLDDPDPSVAISAAWVLTLNDSEQGQKAFRPWLLHKTPHLRIQASAALSSCGKYAFPLAQDILNETSDPYVKLNLAMALIGQRVAVEEACEILCGELLHNKDRWTWEEFGIFQALAPSHLKHEEDVTNPEGANQLVRLDILNIIAMMKYAKAQETITNFLQHKTWGIAGMTTVLLLKEGDEAALELVQNLLTEPQHQVRVQAALILALWGREESAIATLQEAYATANREMKERILEGVGRVGAQSSIPFLIEKLREPSQTLRIIAASSLLQCLYH